MCYNITTNDFPANPLIYGFAVKYSPTHVTLKVRRNRHTDIKKHVVYRQWTIPRSMISPQIHIHVDLRDIYATHMFSRIAIYFPQISTWMDLRRNRPSTDNSTYRRKSMCMLICGIFVMTVFSRTAIYCPQISTWMDLRRNRPSTDNGTYRRKSIHVPICGKYIAVRENTVMTNIPQISTYMDLRDILSCRWSNIFPANQYTDGFAG